MKMPQWFHRARSISMNCVILVNAAIVLVGVWYVGDLTPNYTGWSKDHGVRFFLSRIVDYTLLLLGCINAVVVTVAWAHLVDILKGEKRNITSPAS